MKEKDLQPTKGGGAALVLGTHRLGLWRLRETLLAAFFMRQEGLLQETTWRRQGEGGGAIARARGSRDVSVAHASRKQKQRGESNRRIITLAPAGSGTGADWHFAHLGGSFEAENTLGRHHEERVGLSAPRGPQGCLLLLHVHCRAHFFVNLQNTKVPRFPLCILFPPYRCPSWIHTHEDARWWCLLNYLCTEAIRVMCWGNAIRMPLSVESSRREV